MGKKLFVLLSMIILFSFLGLPIPPWLENIVNAIASFLSAVFSFIMKLIQLLLTLAK